MRHDRSTINAHSKSMGNKGATSRSRLFVSLLAPPWISQRPSVFLTVFGTLGPCWKPGQPTLMRLILHRLCSAAGISKLSLCNLALSSPLSCPCPLWCVDSTSMGTLKVTRLNKTTHSQLQPDTLLYTVWSCSSTRTHTRTHTRAFAFHSLSLAHTPCVVHCKVLWKGIQKGGIPGLIV